MATSKTFDIAGILIIFTPEIKTGEDHSNYRKVLIDLQDGSPVKVDWQPRTSKTTRREAAAFARKHDSAGFAGVLVEMEVRTFVNINMWEI